MIADHDERRASTAARHTEGWRFVLPKQSGTHPLPSTPDMPGALLGTLVRRHKPPGIGRCFELGDGWFLGAPPPTATPGEEGHVVVVTQTGLAMLVAGLRSIKEESPEVSPLLETLETALREGFERRMQNA